MTRQEKITGTQTAEDVLNAHDAEREALIAFYELDEMPMKARLLRDGAPFDYMDLRALEALKAAAPKLLKAA